MGNDIYFVTEELAVCGLFAIHSEEQFSNIGIDSHLQLVDGFEAYTQKYANVEKHLFDDCKVIETTILDKIFSWYKKQKSAEKKILISCAAGESRSVSIAIGCLALSEASGRFLDIASDVCRCIPGAYPHPAPLLSVASWLKVDISLTELRSIYDSIILQPPFPWDDQELENAFMAINK